MEYKEGGLGASLFSLLTAAKPRETLLRLMRLCWCEPEGTKSLSLGFCRLVAQLDQWLCRVVPAVLEPALTGLVECLAALAFPDCFECESSGGAFSSSRQLPSQVAAMVGVPRACPEAPWPSLIAEEVLSHV